MSTRLLCEEVIEQWRAGYNTVRPCSSLEYHLRISRRAEFLTTCRR